MNRITLERRLGEIERELAKLQPPAVEDNPLNWCAWASDDDLDWLEMVVRRAVDHCVDLAAEERARWLEIEAGAIAKMLAGEPDACGRVHQ